MASFVICHGAWGGGWEWQNVATLLRQAGHVVYTPTLTGLGERSHLVNPHIDLHTHIQDVVSVLEYEDLRDVILAGHSYGGMVVTGVAERAPERLRELVYLDAFVPRNGESVNDLVTAAVGPAVAAHMEEAVNTYGEGYLAPPPPSDDQRTVPHPFKTFTQPLDVKSAGAREIPKSFVYCSQKEDEFTRNALDPIMRQIVERAKAEGWRYYELPTEHTLWQTMPQETAEVLLQIAEA